jgi:pyruvate dehydrogenase E1 component beta subunit
MALEAARKLCEHGIEVEVLDLRSIKPMDEEAILESAKKTGRVLVLQETWLTCSVASEVAAVLAEKAFHDLRAPVMRMGAKEAPVPFASVLEHEVLPQVEDIVRRVQELARQ